MLKSYFIIILISVISFTNLLGQKADFRCLEVESNGDVVLTWQAHIDPSGEFNAYQIWQSNNDGVYSIIGSVPNIATTSFTHINAQANQGARYYFIVIEMMDAAGGLYYLQASDTLKSIYLTFDPLPIPQDGFVDVRWNPISDPNPATSGMNYNVLKQINSGGPWQIVDNPTYGNEFYDDPVKTCEDTLSYRISLSDASGCVSISNKVTELILDDKAPGSPEVDSVTVDPATNAVTVYWTSDGSGDIKEYIIIRDGVIIASVAGLNSDTFIDLNALPQNAPTSYTVAAIDTCGSNNASPTTTIHTTINLQAEYSKCDKTISLDFTPYSGVLGVDYTYYIYSEKDGAGFTMLDSITQGELTFVHENVLGSSQYCYYIQAVSQSPALSLASSKSNSICIKTPDLDLPTNFYVNCVSVVDESEVKVSFYISDDSKPTGFTIWRSIYPDTLFEQVGFIGATKDDTLYSFKDFGVGSDTIVYYYTVGALDNCEAPFIFADTVGTVLLSGKSNNREFKNTLTWNYYTGFENAGGYTKSYKFYRSINGNDDYELLEDFQTGEFFYIDDVEPFLNSEGEFCYYVEAVEDSFANIYGFQEACLSNEVCLSMNEIIWYPNAFTPDGDGINEEFKPILSFAAELEYKFIVFDRWGDIIFETVNPKLGFDGIGYRPGLYQFYVQFKNAENETLIRRGSFALIR